MSFIADTWRSRLGTMFPSLTEFSDEHSPFPTLREPVLVVDEDRAWATDCAATLSALGYEPLVAAGVDEAAALLQARAVSIAIVEYNLAGKDSGGAASELVRAAQVQGRRLSVILVTAYVTKETALAAMRASAVDLLEKPFRKIELRQALQRLEGLADALETRESLARTVGGLASALQRLTLLVDGPGPEPMFPAAPPALLDRPASGAYSRPVAPARSAGLPQHIRDLLKNEVRRRQIGGGEVFGDPAWEMLLDLLLAKIEARRVSVSSACIASGAAMSTALRLVGRLVDEGVLQKVPDETDRRRHFLVMEPAFEDHLVAYLSERAEPPAAAPALAG